MDPAEQFSAEHRDLLLELSLLISEQRGVDEIYAAFAAHIHHGITFDFTSLFVTMADARYLRSAGHYPDIHIAAPAGSIHRADVMGSDLLSRQPAGTEYIPRKLDLASTRALAERGFERAWVTPLLVDDMNYGMLTVAKQAHGAFPPDHIAFLRSAASLLATAVRQDMELERARRSAARAHAAGELIFALQAREPFESIFERLPRLLEGALDTDYVGLVIDRGEGFVIGAETPAGVHLGNPPNAEGDATIHKLAEHGDFLQFHPQGEGAQRLIGAGYARGAIAFLRDGGELRGMLMFARVHGRRFDEDERMFIELLRSILSQSLANQHRLDRTEAAAARARTLNEVALLLNAGEEIDAIFQKLLELLDQALEIDYIGLLEAVGEESMRMVGSRPEFMRPAGEHIPRMAADLETLRSSGHPVVQYRIPGAYDHEPFSKAMADAGMRRVAILLVQQGGEIEGLLTLARKNEARLTAEDEAFLETLGAMLGQSIAARKRLQRAQTEAARSKLLNGLALLLNNGEPPAAFFGSLSDQLKRVVPFDALALFVQAGQPGQFTVVDSVRRRGTAAGEVVPASYFGQDILDRVAAGKSAIEADISALGGEVSNRARKGGILRGAAAAIHHDGETVGFFILGREVNVPFSPQELSFLELVAVLVGQAIANRRKVEEKEAEAIRSQVISELVVLLQGGDRVETHFERLAELLLQGVGFDFISVTTRDLTGTGYDISRSHELSEDGRPLEFDPESVAVVLRSGQSVSEYQTSLRDRPVPRALLARGFERAATAVISSPEGVEGLLTVGRRENVPFSPSELSFIQLVAAGLGQASANYQKAYARSAEALRSRVLSELAVLLNNGEPIDTHFQRLRELLLEGVGFDFCSISVREFVPGRFRVMRSEPLLGEDGLEQPVGPSNVDAIVAAGFSSVQYGIEGIEHGAPSALFRIGVQRAASFVLAAGDGPEGLLSIGRKTAQPFTEAEMAFFELVATLLAHAAANERRIAQKTAEAHEQTTIAAAAAAVASETDALAIVRSLRAAIGRFIPSPFVNFGYLEGGHVSFPSKEGGFRDVPIGPRFREALDTGQANVPRPSDRTANLLDEPRRVGIEAHIATRATSGGATVGLLIIGSRDPSFEPGPSEMRLCRLIADIVGPAMANARAVERERQEAAEQRVFADIAAVAAREAEPGTLVAALLQPLAGVVPKPFIAFGYRDGDELSYPRPDGGVTRYSMNDYLRAAEERGQVFESELPEDLPADGDLRKFGVHAISVTAVRSAGATVGFLLIGSRQQGYTFSRRETSTFRLISQIVGPAMENARAAQRARQDAEEQRVLAEAAAGVARATDEVALADSLAEQFGRFIPEIEVALFYVDDDGQGVNGPKGRFPRGPLIARALEEGQSVGAITDPGLPPAASEFITSRGYQRWVGTVATSKGEAVGLMVVATRDAAYEFGERDLRFCRLFADFVGPAMANLRESARRRDEAEEQRILAEAAAAVASASDESALMVGLRAPIEQFVPGARVMLFYHEGTHMSVYGTGHEFPLGPQVRRALAGEQIVGHIEDPEILPGPRGLLRQQGTKRFADTPIVSGGESLGVLYVGTQDESFEFSERDLRLFRLIAGFAGPAMANLRESARRQAEAREQRILAEAAAAIAAGATETEILNGLVKPIRRLIARARVAFSYVEGDEMWLWDGRNRRPIHGNSRLALDTGQAIGNQDTTTSPQSRELIGSAGVTHWVDTAATSAGAPIGLLFVGTVEADYVFSEGTLRLLRLIADMTGPAMINARENARRRNEAEDERILAEVAAAAARANRGEELIDALPALLAPLVPQAFALYGFIDGETLSYQITRPADRQKVGTDELTLRLTDVGRAARDSGQAAGSLANLPAGVSYAALNLKEYALTSYYSAGAPIGVLLISTTDAAFRFDPRALALLKRIVQVVGPAVESSRAEAERARQAGLYSLMLRSLSEGVVLSDIEGKVVFANDLGRRILRALDPENTATGWMDIIDMLPEGVRDGYQAVYERGEGSRGRTCLDFRGRPTWFDYELVPLNDPVMKILMVAADVTVDVEREAEQERHREQMEQSQRLAALGELIGGVAHELNNPLTAILGFAEVMALSADSAPLSEELSIIQKEALRARNIVRDLLFIARPGTSERSLVPVGELVTHIERLRRADWVKLGIQWQIEVEQRAMVWGNEHQLTQVLLNLVTNAEQAFAGRTEKRITIRASTTGNETSISVSDTGAGMDESIRGRVFEPFFTTKHGLGTGLGLPLSYSIVQSHGGEIRVDSEPEQGATFTLTLPATPDIPAMSTVPDLEKPIGAVRVLVVDDEPSLRKVCQRLILSMGYECATAENSAVAIELAAETEFDLVLCDYRLAHETADAVVAGFERVAPYLIPRMVIATGATTDPGVLGLTERFGLHLMAKPYGADELAAVIQRAVRAANQPSAGAA